ncbi:MAG TPA: PDZ domain-containing protein [Nitrospiria bacterium]|nr:PDZ domain-containing protein [Nitrospiria bacterium]
MTAIAGNTRLLIGGGVIVAADGQPIASSDDLNRFLRTKRPGESVDLTVAHEGARRHVRMTLGERPHR